MSPPSSPAREGPLQPSAGAEMTPRPKSLLPAAIRSKHNLLGKCKIHTGGGGLALQLWPRVGDKGPEGREDNGGLASSCLT